VETKAHLCFLKNVGGRCGCVYGTKGAVDRKSLGTAVLRGQGQALNTVLSGEGPVTIRLSHGAAAVVLLSVSVNTQVIRRCIVKPSGSQREALSPRRHVR
jgi:hypothetical protein